MTSGESSINRVAIIIPTKNRSDFMVRQLNYYAAVGSIHPIYIVDSSDQEHLAKVQDKIAELKNNLEINYYTYHKPDRNFMKFLIDKVKEPYACFCGDDDFQVADTLTKAAEFLNKNPDYESAGGVSVTFETDSNKAYGRLAKTHDYPRYEISAETAARRLIDFLSRYYTAMVSVNRTANMARQWDNAEDVEDEVFKNEMIPCSLTLISGKSKLIDNIGFIHQIHGYNSLGQLDMYDWLTHPGWRSSYLSFRDKLAEAIMAKDGISKEKAELAVKIGFWGYLAKYVPKRYSYLLNILNPPKLQTNLRHKVAAALPGAREFYHRYIRPITDRRIRLHYEVLNPRSKYYKDCQPIWDLIKN